MCRVAQDTDDVIRNGTLCWKKFRLEGARLCAVLEMVLCGAGVPSIVDSLFTLITTSVLSSWHMLAPGSCILLEVVPIYCTGIYYARMDRQCVAAPLPSLIHLL